MRLVVFLIMSNLLTSENHHSATCQGEAEDNVPENIEWAKPDSSIINSFSHPSPLLAKSSLSIHQSSIPFPGDISSPLLIDPLSSTPLPYMR